MLLPIFGAFKVIAALQIWQFPRFPIRVMSTLPFHNSSLRDSLEPKKLTQVRGSTAKFDSDEDQLIILQGCIVDRCLASE